MMVREIEVHTESMAEQKLGGYSSRYRFTGKELDPLSGLYDFGARYYDPRLSVWFGVDPLAEKNFAYTPYVYTGNNPIKFIDPDGKDWYEDKCSGKMQWFDGSGKQDGFIHRGAEYQNGRNLYTTTSDGKSPLSFDNALPEVEIKGEASWHKKLYQGLEKATGVTEVDLRNLQGKELLPQAMSLGVQVDFPVPSLPLTNVSFGMDLLIAGKGESGVAFFGGLGMNSSQSPSFSGNLNFYSAKNLTDDLKFNDFSGSQSNSSFSVPTSLGLNLGLNKINGSNYSGLGLNASKLGAPSVSFSKSNTPSWLMFRF